MKHTPTPWIAGSGRARLCIFSADDQSIRHGEPIANCELFDAADEDEANADFIIKACNAHDPLLEAAKLGRDYLKKFANDACKGRALFTAAAVDVDVEKIEKAIALAEGEEG